MSSLLAPSDVDSDASRAALLDLGTQLVAGTWCVVVAPDCGEASAAHFYGSPGSKDESEDGEESAWSGLSQEVKDELNRERARRRSTKNLRQFAVQNMLTALHTLTYRCVACDGDPCTCGLKAGPESRAEVKRHMNRFIKRLRKELGGGAFPYLYVIERGKRGTRRLHVHLLLPAEHAPTLVALCWGHGHVDYQEPRAGLGKREQARRAAGYLAKYLAKSLGDEDPAWAHSYERAQGFNVRVIRRRLRDLSDVLWFIDHFLGEGVTLSLCTDWQDYEGPPAFVARERVHDG